MKIRYFLILFLSMFIFSCADTPSDTDEPAEESAISDSTADTDEDATTDASEEVVDTEEDATTGTSEVAEDEGNDDESSDVTTEDVAEDEEETEEAVSYSFTKIDLSGVTALAIKRIDTQSLSNISGRSMSVSGDSECDELGSLSGGVYTEIINDGSSPCVSEVEYWEGGDETMIYGKYYTPESTSDTPASKFMSISSDIKSFITDSDGYVHELPGNPKRRTGFKNTRMIKNHNGSPHYINSEGKLVWFDFDTDTEEIVLDRQVTNFSFKAFSDGDHIIFDSSGDVKRINPDQTEEILTGVPQGQWHDIDGGIQYGATKVKRMRFDSDGNIESCTGVDTWKCRSDPVNYNFWINNAVQLNGNAAMPQELSAYSLSGCDDKAVGDQRIMICNGKSFRVGGVDVDLEDINLCDYGHCGLNSWLTIKSCTSSNYVYFYGEDTLGRFRLTWIDYLTGEFRDILNTHQISDLECVSDSKIYVVGTVEELTESLVITEADTVLPVISVIDSQITDIITP